MKRFYTGMALQKVMTKELMKFVLSTKLKSILRNNKYTKKLKKLLPDISDVNLRQQLSRARKLYKLFNAVGVEKIKQVTYSANAISNLNTTQIQNIIDYVISKTVTGGHQTPKNNQINASEAQEQSLY